MKLVVARKEHTCTACGRAIPRGHSYWSDYDPGDEETPSKNIKEHTNCRLYVVPLTAQPRGTK